MFRCGRCGSAKFFYTTSGDEWGPHHGALCAFCHKRLNVHDTAASPATPTVGASSSRENPSPPPPFPESS